MYLRRSNLAHTKWSYTYAYSVYGIYARTKSRNIRAIFVFLRTYQYILNTKLSEQQESYCTSGNSQISMGRYMGAWHMGFVMGCWAKLHMHGIYHGVRLINALYGISVYNGTQQPYSYVCLGKLLATRVITGLMRSLRASGTLRAATSALAAPILAAMKSQDHLGAV